MKRNLSLILLGAFGLASIVLFATKKDIIGGSIIASTFLILLIYEKVSNFQSQMKIVRLYANILNELKHSYNIPEWHILRIINDQEEALYKEK